MTFLLLYFIFLLILVWRNKSIVIFFLLIQIVSVLGIFVLQVDFPINTNFRAINLMMIAVLLTLIIMPWRKYNKIKEIYFYNESKIDKLTNFLIIISILPFIILSITSTFVYLYVDDINYFKYADNGEVATAFYYRLPFNVKLFILSIYLYNFSYFLIPLHFYYLGKQRYLKSFLCFFFSLNILLHGISYFSRAVMVHYFFLYISLFFMLHGILNSKTKRFFKVFILIILLLATNYFIYISKERFTTDISYEKTIPPESLIQDPVIYSYLDYMSQWYYNGMYVLDSYDFKTFSGQISLQSVLSLLGQYGIINYNSDAYSLLRKEFWPLHYYTFNGFVAYSIFDYGYFISIILALLYYYFVAKRRPKQGRISLKSLFSLSLLIQIPITAIFYSNVGAILIPMIMLIPIYIYCRGK